MADLKTASQDQEYEDSLVGQVRPEGTGWDVRFKEGWMLFVQPSPEVEAPREPRAGDTLRLFGKGIGHVVRGVGLVENGRLTALYRYLTREEQEAAHKAEVLALNLAKQKEWADKSEETARRIKAMPEPFRKRFEFFMRRPDWGWEFGPYELFCCEEGIKIAEKLKNELEIVDFTKASIEDQKKLVSELAYDQHSGNTFHTACRLAQGFVRKNNMELVPKMHGSLCPLVGCQLYGCWSTTPEASDA